MVSPLLEVMTGTPKNRLPTKRESNTQQPRVQYPARVSASCEFMGAMTKEMEKHETYIRRG